MNKNTFIFIVIFGLVLFAFMVFLNSWCEDVSFYLTHKNPVAFKETQNVIDPFQEPVQIDLPEFQKMIKVKTKDKLFFVEPIAKYSISAMVLGTNMKLGTWGFSRKDFDYIALTDVALGWGEVSDKVLFKNNIKYLKQQKYPNGARMYWWELSPDSSWSVDYVRSHTSHNHMVAANHNIMSVLYSLKKFETVKMEGYLVDIYKDGSIVAMTSTSRDDTDGSSRGRSQGKPGGSCEIFYVNKIHYNGKIYK